MICKRKKTTLQQEIEQRETDAFRRINSSLDVLNIIRLFNLLKVVTHLFFEDRHFELAQYVGFDLWRNEAKARMARAKDEKDKVEKSLVNLSRKQKKKARIEKMLEIDKERFNSSLRLLKDKVLTSVDSFDELSQKVTEWVDTFYYLHVIGDVEARKHSVFEDINTPQFDEILLRTDNPPRTSVMFRDD